MEGVDGVVPHGVERSGELATVAALLLDGERQPGVAEAVTDPDQVGPGPDHRCHERRPHLRSRPGSRATRGGASRARRPRARPGAPRPAGRHRRPVRRRRPTTTGRYRMPRKATTDAQQQGARRHTPARASRPTGRGRAATPSAAPAAGRRGRGGPAAAARPWPAAAPRWPPPPERLRVPRRGRGRATDRGAGREGRSATTPGRRRVAVVGDRPVPAGVPPEEAVVHPLQCRRIAGTHGPHRQMGHHQCGGHQ